MKVEHDRKKASDEEKFQSLLEQKQDACEQFKETLERLSLEQNTLIEKLTLEHHDELQQAKEKKTQLEEESLQMAIKIKTMRAETEQSAWKEYISVNDKNSNVLAENIEKGLENKAELTKSMRELTA